MDSNHNGFSSDFPTQEVEVYSFKALTPDEEKTLAAKLKEEDASRPALSHPTGDALSHKEYIDLAEMYLVAKKTSDGQEMKRFMTAWENMADQKNAPANPRPVVRQMLVVSLPGGDMSKERQQKVLNETCLGQLAEDIGVMFVPSHDQNWHFQQMSF